MRFTLAPLAWLRRHWRPTLLVAAICVVAAVATGSELYMFRRAYGEPIGAWGALWPEAVEWILWGAVTPLILAVDRRLGFGARRWPRAVAMHLAVLVTWFALHNAVMTGISLQDLKFSWGHTFPQGFLIRAIARFPLAVVVYALIVAIGYAVREFAERHRREAHRAQLEAQLATARLQNLKMQLQPHFFFNTLHTIAGHVREGERAAAVDMLSRLGDLLRRSLADPERHEVSLDEELEFLDTYLAIQRARFGERLAVRIDAPADTRDALVPGLILQPLVENAITHGVAHQPAGGAVTIMARRANGRLTLEVRDTGPGLKNGVTEGVGLRNTRERLGQLYGKDQRFTLAGSSQGETVATIDIPYRNSATPIGGD